MISTFLILGSVLALAYGLDFFLTVHKLKKTYNKKDRSYTKIIKMIDKRMTPGYGTKDQK